MKKKRKYKEIISVLLAGILFSCSSNYAAENQRIEEKSSVEVAPIKAKKRFVPPVFGLEDHIKIALLLDTSSSMDGLLEQAKSQLWKIVNQLAKARKGDQFAKVQIALYEYGNTAINVENGYVRQVIGLTDDLDELSKQLFALTTNGGEEYCGQVITKSIAELDWQKETGGLQVMFIAGNEPFDQGTVDYTNACTNAVQSDIIINTIFCGDLEDGINTKWKHGADLTEGFYGAIEMNEATVYIETPYDDTIQSLNSKLNNTYVVYGSQGVSYCLNQTLQDENSSLYGKSNAVERTVSKSNQLYLNYKWDLVDAKKEKDFDITTIKKDELPTEMQGMTETEKLAYINTKQEERTSIQEQIKKWAELREEFIVAKKKEMGIEMNGLDYAMLEAIRKQAIAKDFNFKKV